MTEKQPDPSEVLKNFGVVVFACGVIVAVVLSIVSGLAILFGVFVRLFMWAAGLH